MYQKQLRSKSALKMKQLLFIILLMSMIISVNAQDSDSTASPEGTESATAEPTTTPPPPERPEQTVVFSEGDYTVELLFEVLRQGRAGLVYLEGTDISSAKISFLNQVVDFFYIPDDGYYALISVSMEQAPREYDFEVYVTQQDGQQTTISGAIQVNLGGFLREDFDVPPDRGYLIDPDVERTEFARLFAVFENSEPTPLWTSEQFKLPIMAELTSSFGSVRTLNDTVQTRHTGWDIQSKTGTPVLASASGRVAFAGALDIRGNHIIIDHGSRVFSTYSHLSVINVTRGQTVNEGQIIGMSGNTGRSSGAHFHWEINVNGEWVDSADFSRMWLPY